MWQRMHPREKIFLYVLGLIGFGFLIFTYLLYPQYKAHNANKMRLEVLRSQLREAEALISTREEETVLAGKTLELLNNVKPSFNNIISDGTALALLGLKAGETGVEIISAKPLPSIDKEIYHEIPYHLEVRGSYLKIIDFIEELENLTEVTELRTLHIKPFAENKTLPKPEFHMDGYPSQDGRVVAAFDIVIYNVPAPDNKIKPAQLENLRTGRENAFLTPDVAVPHPNVSPHL